MDRYDYAFPRRDKQSNAWAILGGIAIAIVLAAIVLWALGIIPFGRHDGPLHDPNVRERAPAPRTDHTSLEQERIHLYKTASPSVVSIDTMAANQRGAFDDDEKNLGTGSGFFWDDQGRIVTNFHVIRPALALTNQSQVVVNPSRRIMATLNTGESIPTELVGIAPDTDLAVIKLTRLPAGGVKKVTVGASNDLVVGQSAYAIGTPFGQKTSLTCGVISALDRSIQSPTQAIITGVIQTDAALNPGNSGGPLYDKDVRLIGVNTAITTPSGGSVGIGYAIPVDTVNSVVTQIIRSGRVVQPYIGAEYVLEEWYVRRMGIAKGVVIKSVKRPSPAATAGLLPGDIILKANDKEIVGLADLERVLGRVKVGDTLNFTIRRRGQELEIPVQVEGI